MADTFDTPSEIPLNEHLMAFGFSETESRVYLHLTSQPPQTIVELARDLNLPRTSVHDAVTKLASRGLLERIINYKSQRFRAYPVDMLQSYIDGQEEHIQQLRGKLELLQASTRLGAHQNAKTTVRYYHGPQGIRQMIRNTLRAQETLGYSQLGRSEIVGKGYFERQLQERVDRGITDRVIINPASTPRAKDAFYALRRQYQKVRIIPEHVLYISGDTTIYEDVFSITYWGNGEIVGVEIQNAELARAQKSIFEQLWLTAEPLDPSADDLPAGKKLVS